MSEYGGCVAREETKGRGVGEQEMNDFQTPRGQEGVIMDLVTVAILSWKSSKFRKAKRAYMKLTGTECNIW